MKGTTTRYEAYCDHCKSGVISRDSLILSGTERLCARCCQAREERLARVQALSGRILLACVVFGAGIGFAAGQYIGLFPGVIFGLLLAGFVEHRMKRY